MKTIAALALLICSASSHADIIKCLFTEPFIDTEYSMTQSTLTYRSAEGKVTVVKDISLQIRGPGSFILMNHEGKVIQTLTLNQRGSDGMSDQVYPYDVKDSSMTQFANGGVGGCTSNFLRVQKTN